MSSYIYVVAALGLQCGCLANPSPLCSLSYGGNTVHIALALFLGAVPKAENWLLLLMAVVREVRHIVTTFPCRLSTHALPVLRPIRNVTGL